MEVLNCAGSLSPLQIFRQFDTRSLVLDWRPIGKLNLDPGTALVHIDVAQTSFPGWIPLELFSYHRLQFACHSVSSSQELDSASTYFVSFRPWTDRLRIS